MFEHLSLIRYYRLFDDLGTHNMVYFSACQQKYPSSIFLNSLIYKGIFFIGKDVARPVNPKVTPIFYFLGVNNAISKR